jgi:hypothetical protein
VHEYDDRDLHCPVRIMRVLTCSGVFTEVGEEVYKHNKLSTTLSNAGFLSTVKFTCVKPSLIGQHSNW